MILYKTSQKSEIYLKQSEIIAKAYKIKFYAGEIIKIYVKKGFSHWRVPEAGYFILLGL